MLITFSGLDGAGKSTLIAWCRAELERRHQPVRVFHLTDDVGVYAYLRTIRDWLTGNGASGRGAAAAAPQGAEPAGLRRRLRNALLWNKGIRRALYPIDLLIFLGYRLYFEKVRGCVLLLDRYFYDTLVDVADEGRWTWVRLLEGLTPTPTVAVFLDTSPEESYARKGEYSVDYLRRRAVAYRYVAPLVASALVLANDDLENTKAALAQVVLHRMAP